MGILDSLLGNSQADAAKRAAADTFAKQQAAGGALRDYGDQYAGSYADLAEGYDPYVDTGYTANSAVQRLLADPSSVASLPGYQFQLGQGAKALDHSATAGGSLFSGKAGKDLTRFGQNLADTSYGTQLQRLLGVSGQGQQALGQQNATVGQGLNGQLQTRTASYGGDMNAAGTIGQGDIAAENAKTSALQNLLGTAAYLGGSALGGGFGGGLSSFFKGSSATNNPFGGVPNPTFGR